MFNKIILVGNLTRDIEMRYAGSGTAIANTAIATSRKFTKDGEKKEEVCFIDITFFGRSAEVCNQYLRKGSKILVEGRLKLDTWVDNQSGAKRSKHTVIVETMQMLDTKDNSQTNGNAPTNQNNQQNAQTYQPRNDKQSTGNYGSQNDNVGYGGRTYNANQQQRPPANTVPTIDVDEEEIPF